MPLLDKLFSVVAPHMCVICQTEGSLLCRWCAPDAFPAVPSRCYRCQRLTLDNATCEKCLRSYTPRHVWVATEYEAAAKSLIHSFKFERARAAAPIIARSMSATLPFMKSDTLIVPIPTATARIRQRGYDHAGLLADHIAQYQQLQYIQAVSRLTQSRQVGANRRERLTQLEDAFIAAKPGSIRGATILLVDDVITTGATLEAVATVLKQSGAKQVNAIVFAQKQ